MEIITASREHIDMIVRHRIEMFRSMGWTDDELESTRPIVKRFLKEKLDDRIRAYLAVVDGEVVGGCAIGMGVSLPTYRNPSGRSASIHNLFVEPSFRKQGIGLTLMKHALDVCRSEGIRRVTLQATDMGLGIYEQLGFSKVDNHYKLILE